MTRRSLFGILAGGVAAVFGFHYATERDPPKHPRLRQRPAPQPSGPRTKPVKEWMTSAACEGRKQCCACRGDVKFQAQLAEHFIMPGGWPECPYGITLGTLPETSQTVDVPEWYHARLALCIACDADCWPSSCRRNMAIRRPYFACPRDHFRPVLATRTS